MDKLIRDSQTIGSLIPIELYGLDLSTLGGSVLHFYSGVNGNNQPLVWQGITYSPLPIESEGFDITGNGTLPRPKIRVANIDGIFSSLVMNYDDLIGCKLIRRRTFAKYLDAVNFVDGNPDADPFQEYPPDIWFFERKISENRFLIEWELASAFDLQGVLLPRRQIIQNSCSWIYKSAECSWVPTDRFYDKNDLQTIDQAQDFCGKRLSSCKVRFRNGVLPFGGFPGAIRYDG